jgi:hypothetical protein
LLSAATPHDHDDDGVDDHDGLGDFDHDHVDHDDEHHDDHGSHVDDHFDFDLNGPSSRGPGRERPPWPSPNSA